MTIGLMTEELQGFRANLDNPRDHKQQHADLVLKNKFLTAMFISNTELYIDITMSNQMICKRNIQSSYDGGWRSDHDDCL